MALLSTAGMVPLYSGVTARTRSAAATDSRSAVALAGSGLAVDLLVVERDGVEALDDVDGHTGGGVVAEVLGDAAVEAAGAGGAEEDGDAGLLVSGHDGLNGPRSASIPGGCETFSHLGWRA